VVVVVVVDVVFVLVLVDEVVVVVVVVVVVAVEVLVNTAMEIVSSPAIILILVRRPLGPTRQSGGLSVLPLNMSVEDLQSLCAAAICRPKFVLCLGSA
jgi:hypothetical protein